MATTAAPAALSPARSTPAVRPPPSSQVSEIRARVWGVDCHLMQAKPEWGSEVLCRLQPGSARLRLGLPEQWVSVHFARLQTRQPMHRTPDLAARSLIADLTEQLAYAERPERDAATLPEGRPIDLWLAAARDFWATLDKSQPTPKPPRGREQPARMVPNAWPLTPHERARRRLHATGDARERAVLVGLYVERACSYISEEIEEEQPARIYVRQA